MRGDPREGSFHDPAFREGLEVALPGVFPDDLDGGSHDLARPVDEPAGEAAVREQMTTVPVIEIMINHDPFSAVAVLDAGGQDEDAQQESSVSVMMNRLRPLTFLPAS